MEISRSAVIPQAAPQSHDVIQAGRSQGLNVRKPLQKPIEITHHRDHLGLLQHDFRQPNAVRVLGILPRQVVPAMHFLPRNDVLSKLQSLRRRCHGFWHVGQ